MTETKSNNDTTDNKEKKVLTLSGAGRGKLELKRPADAGQVRQSFSHGRSKTVQVEVKRKRAVDGGSGGDFNLPPGVLTDNEREARMRALRGAIVEGEELAGRQAAQRAEIALQESLSAENDANVAAEAALGTPARPLDPEALRKREMEELRRIDADEKSAREEAELRRQENVAMARKREAGGQESRVRGGPIAPPPRQNQAPGSNAGQNQNVTQPQGPTTIQIPGMQRAITISDDEDEGRNKRRGGGGGNKAPAKAPAAKRGGDQDRRRSGKMNVHQVLNDDGN